jgi:pyrroloquinoline-quinone synthase
MCGSCDSAGGFLYLVRGNTSQGQPVAEPLTCIKAANSREDYPGPLTNWVGKGKQAMTKIMSPEELEQELRAIGAERYHDKHPFHKLLHGGKLNKGQVQAWALNRYCYQSAVPRKDAALMSRCHDRQLRRDWIHRIMDHDGFGEEEGGIERWLVLTDGLGLDRDYVISRKGALPETVFAVEAYVNFVREKTLVEAVASSLTELFAPKIHKERISGMLENYDFISDEVMAYFKRRLTQAPDDANFALEYVKRNARTPEAQSAALDALRFKCNVLWAQLDALHYAYVEPGLIPPGAFVPATA